MTNLQLNNYLNALGAVVSSGGALLTLIFFACLGIWAVRSLKEALKDS